MSDKTLAMLVLEGKKVEYRTHRYDDALRDAEEIAGQLDFVPAQVYKTLVVTRSTGKPFLVMLPGDKQLDLKEMAKQVGEKKVKMATHREAEGLTGLEVGGISALALINRGFDVCLDAEAKEWSTICVSAGQRGIQLEVPVDDLVRLTRARFITLAR